MATTKPATQGANRRARVTARPLIFVGGGEHAAVVVDAARAEPGRWRPLGFTDIAPAADARRRLGISHLGDDAVLDRYIAEAVAGGDRTAFVCAIGSPAERRRAVVARLGPEAIWATIVHPTAWVSPSATLGEGTVVLAGATVNAAARIGRHAIVNSRVVVEHDVEVGDFVHIGPGAVVGGGAVIGDDAFVGLGALVRDHVVIGSGATVGMGAVVVDDVESDATVVGSPARPRAVTAGSAEP